MSDEWIRASEIAEYVYCQRAWWLRRVQGQTSTNIRPLQQGTVFHEQHGRSVQRAQWANRLAYLLLVLALFFVVAQFFIS